MFKLAWNKIVAVVFVFLSLPMAVGMTSGPAEAAPASKVRISGSSTIKPVVMVAARVLGKKQKLAFNVSGGSAAQGITDLTTRKAELAMADRYLETREILAHPDLQYTTIGFDGIALIVNRDNPVESLSKAQVKRLFTGAVGNWKELGGGDVEIVTVSMGLDESSRAAFTGYFGLGVAKMSGGLRFTDATGKEGPGKVALIARRNSAAILKVGNNPGAIAYLSAGAALRAQGKLGTIRRIALDGVKATRENVKNKNYPIVRPLNIVTLGTPRGKQEILVDYLLSPHGQNIVKNLDYTPIR